MTNLVLFIVLLVGVAIGAIIGLVICANTELGDLTSVEVPRDPLKCLILSGVIAAIGVGLFELAHNARVFIALVPIYYLGLKLCWLQLTLPEVVVIGLCTVASLAIVIEITARILV